MNPLAKKLFGWCAALVVILACAPGAVAPISTLDANAVSTYVAQTANVAGTQTANAMPIYPATSTLAPTFTAEATNTALPVIHFPTPDIIQKTQYFRVMHDNQLALYNYRSRTADPNWPNDKWGLQTPEVVPLFMDLKITSGTNRTPLTGVWEQFINALNFNNKKKLNYVKADNTALFNNAGFPQMESLTMGGNIVTLDEVRNGWGRVHTLNYYEPGKLEEITYLTAPNLVHKFVVVGWNRDKKVTYFTNPPPPYGDLYFPLVSDSPVWIQMSRLESFPILPLTVTATRTQDIREKPALDSPLTSFDFDDGESARVVEYFPSGSYVWGRLASGGWIGLLIYEKGALVYPTDWKMNTMPPLPPVE
jgi:hypothetical protein